MTAIKTVGDVVANLTDGGKTLSLSGRKIGDAEANIIAAALANCPSLKTLSLGGNSIGADGAKALVAALPNCPSLQNLFLDDNIIGADGAKALAAALPNCPSLQTLNLNYNTIGNDGAKGLAAVLPNCPSLETLRLRSNSIGPYGAKALAAALPNCPSLQRLYLTHNSIGPEGAKALAAALLNSPSLQTLYLADNSIGDDGAKALAAALPNCPSLRWLNFSGNQLSDSLTKQIAAEIEKNNQPDRVHQTAAKRAQARADRQATNKDTGESARLGTKQDGGQIASRHNERRLRPEHDKLAGEVEGEWMETMPEIHTCTICQEKLASGESVLLPACLHAVCRKDATYQLQQNQSVTCAVCQIPSTPTGTPLPAHPLVEATLAGGEVPLCKKCLDDDAESTVPAVFVCKDCDWPLCDGHTTIHRAVPKFKAHALVLLPSSKAASPRCPAHGEPLMAYCGACKEVTCNYCLASTHPPSAAHPSVLLDETFVRSTRQRLLTQVQVVRSAAKELVNRAADARVTLDDVVTRDAEVDSQIVEMFKALRGLLDQREHTLRQQLREASAAEQRIFRESEAADGQRWRVFTSAANLAEEVASDALGASAPTVLAQLEPAATARLRSLVAGAPTDSVPFPAAVHFRATNADAVLAAIESAGEVVVAKGSIF